MSVPKSKQTVMLATTTFKTPLEPMGTRLEKQVSKLSTEYQENIPVVSKTDSLTIVKKKSVVNPQPDATDAEFNLIGGS